MSYPDIFQNVETHAEPKDHQAVIAAMKCLAEGQNLDEHLDSQEIIRYFAAHNFVLNYDSYTGTMLHNLVLFENNGRLSVLPWDYNSAFGAFTAAIGDEALRNPTDLLNRGIDSPLIGTDEDSRPLWRWIVQDAHYRQMYHDALNDLVTDYFESGLFERQFTALSHMLLPYLEKDPTAFYTAEACRKGCETLKQFALRRAESVRKQLDGTLPTYSDAQAEQDQVKASDLHLLEMGAAIPPDEGNLTGERITDQPQG